MCEKREDHAWRTFRKHKDINLVTNQEAYLKRVIKPNFKSGIQFSKNVMGCEMGKIRVLMNKSVNLGQVIFDLSSKIVMYEFHYDYMLPKYSNDLQLCYMDSDSFVYDIETDSFLKDFANDVEARFDTSSYCQNCPFPIEVNKKVIGLMTNELGGRIMPEFVALNTKAVCL